ncbi:amphi-Trp domain-containing protein [Hydrogenovibrio sp. SC-1]|uniref:amphi-Trp domain-containing protein n=1 Tax=Hydrogenovibrio sp. SC-1 TaxID=2065820 RepID=UPI000C7C078D|nr:amphi-Trp domain-containing protein [Hydrogenovibrio sp. SC-1]PLA74466.1 amphi-Trp domain-containing protein [Hydrogenovibrio sp. SC-1]
MAKKTPYFEHESLQDKDAIVSYLKAITQGFKKGAIKLSDEDEDFVLTPQAFANLKIKATQSKKGQTLNIKINWSSDQDEDADDAPLFIAPKTPKKSKNNKKSS